MSGSLLPTFFITHGGGPWAYMQGEMRQMHAGLENHLKALPKMLGKAPQAILMISGHWEENDFTLMTHPNPPMLYDYGGFPKHTYQVTYPAPNSLALAEQVQALLGKAGIKTAQNSQRGYDHGAFVPLAVSFLEAKIPVVQLSLRRDLDPTKHFAAGRALASLREQGILLIGSGSSYHNLRNFGPGARDVSKQFDDWLTQAVVNSCSEERTQKLIQWSSAPSAQQAHPREEHLVPLFVVAGAAENEAAVRDFHEDSFFGGIAISGYRFGALPAVDA